MKNIVFHHSPPTYFDIMPYHNLIICLGTDINQNGGTRGRCPMDNRILVLDTVGIINNLIECGRCIRHKNIVVLRHLDGLHHQDTVPIKQLQYIIIPGILMCLPAPHLLC